MIGHRAIPDTSGYVCAECGRRIVKVTAYRPVRVGDALVGVLHYRPSTWYQHAARKVAP